VGSSNLNLASWLGNYELDAVIEDTGFAQTMMEQYERDLGNATEILLPVDRRRLLWRPPRENARPHTRRARPSQGDSGSAGRAVAGAVRLGNTVTAAVTEHRALQPADARVIAVSGIGLLLIAGIVLVWPRVLAIPAAIVLLWIGGALLVRSSRLLRRRTTAAGLTRPAAALPEDAPHTRPRTPASGSGAGP
jgi:cardiolipin synthase A/B